MALSLVTPPAIEPVTLAEAKVHCRQDINDEDALIQTLVSAARQHVETFCGRALITQTWDWSLDGFPCGQMDLPMANITAISSVSYVDTAGVTQTLASSVYQADLPVGPKALRGRWQAAYQQIWPVTRCQMNAVTMRFVAGYGSSAASVPESIKAAMLLLVGHWFLNRESVVVGPGMGAVELPRTVDAMLWPFKAF